MKRAVITVCTTKFGTSIAAREENVLKNLTSFFVKTDLWNCNLNIAHRLKLRAFPSKRLLEMIANVFA